MRLRIFRILFYIVAALAIFLSLERLCHLATDGFSILKVSYPLESSPSEEAPPSEITSILSQRFTYLDSGAQCYVFASEDDEYVIKFFKFQHMRIPTWMSYLPLPKDLESIRSRKIVKKHLVISKLFTSYTIAYTSLQKETGLIYLHLNKTKKPLPLHLIDKIGIHYSLEGSKLAFVIQRKGTLLYKALEQDLEKKDIDHAKELIDSVLNLSIKRCQKGIGDQDPDFRTNFGIINEDVVQLDTGRFYLDPQETDPEIYKREIYRITRQFRMWLSEKNPKLLSYFDERIEQIKEGSFF